SRRRKYRQRDYPDHISHKWASALPVLSTWIPLAPTVSCTARTNRADRGTSRVVRRQKGLESVHLSPRQRSAAGARRHGTSSPGLGSMAVSAASAEQPSR